MKVRERARDAEECFERSKQRQINDLLRKDKQRTKEEKHKSKDWRER